MCSVNASYAQCYLAGMQPEQQVIAKWLERVRAKRGWSWNEWAKSAKIGAATTLSRAVKEDYGSVTKIETLHALARAANEPSVLDFLEGDAVSVAGLKTILAELLPLALPPRGKPTEQDVERLVAALAYGLGLKSTDPATPTSEDAFEVAARAAAARYRDLAAEA